MTNGTSNYASLYDPSKMTVGGAAGAFTVDAVPNGDAKGNTQQYGFQSGVDVGPATGVFTAHTRVAAPFAGITPQPSQSMGLFVGTGDQDNYAKLVVSANGGKGGVQFATEKGGAFSARPQPTVAMPGPEAVDLYLTVDPQAGTVQPSYSVTSGGVTGPRTELGGPESIPAGWVDGTKALAAGFISTSNGTAPEFTATWDFVEVVRGDGTKPADTADPTISRLKPSGKTRDRTPRISAVVRDAGSELAKSDIKLYVDGKARAFSYDAATDRLSGVSRRLSYGGHAVKVVATDDSGNRASEAWRFKVVRRR